MMASSQPMQVLITIPLADDLLARLQRLSPLLKVTHIPARKVEEIPVEVWNRTEILYTAWLMPDPELVPNLRWIQSHLAGVDYALSSPILAQENVRFTTLSGAAASQVAEFALTMMLALGHRVPALLEAQSGAEWPEYRYKRFNPVEIRGATVGLVGYGSIARQLARLLHPMGASILAIKRDVLHPADDGFIYEDEGDPHGDYFTRLYPVQALHSVLKKCDYVVLTLPLTNETRGLFGEKALAAMKPGSFLIQVGRGGVIDEDALLKSLQDGHLGGAALDVFQHEPLPAEHPFWRLPNMIISPHIAWLSPHYNERAMALFSENLHRYLAGSPLLNQYKPERGY